MQIVGPVNIVAAGVPLIKINAPEIDYPQQGRQVLDHGKVNDVSRRMIDGADLHPRGSRRRRMLHEKEVARRPVGVSLHDHGPIPEVRKKHRRHISVVLKQMALRYSQRGPERFFQIGELDCPVPDTRFEIRGIFWDLDSLHRARLGTGRRFCKPRWMVIARRFLHISA